jgi:hypothetical protein
MKSEKILTAWIEQKSKLEGEMDFTHGVMQQVDEYDRNRQRSWTDRIRIPQWVWIHPMARAGWIGAASVVGFVRGVFLMRVVLGG